MISFPKNPSVSHMIRLIDSLINLLVISSALLINHINHEIISQAIFIPILVYVKKKSAI